jgi:FlaA1/EpsC-like NDP-sugar epimerase
MPPLRSINANVRQWVMEKAHVGPALAVLGTDLILVSVAFLLNIRFFSTSADAWPATMAFFPLVLALRAVALALFGVIQSSLRYASLADLVAIAKAVVVSSAAWYGIYQLWPSSAEIPGVMFVTEAALSFVYLAAFHFSARIYNSQCAKNAADARRVIVVGAGDAGAAVLNELVCDPGHGIRPVAIIDDDPAKRGTRICGVPVVGTVADLSEIVFRFGASEVLLCIPSASQAQRRRLLVACRECGLPVRTLPSMPELITGRVSWRDLRNVGIEDLLQRTPANTDDSWAKALVSGKTVLVTGAGGSIGSELSRQLAVAGPRRLILLDKSENNLFYSHMAVQEGWPSVDVEPVLADILDQHHLSELFAREQPDLVFHVAAFKHVGMMERHPYQAIKNNVLGTWRLLKAAQEAGVKCFVNISTDKAVNPCNYMGLSKKLAEKLVRAMAAQHQTPFMNVRFGNVAGSSGSVLQIFSEQIRKGGPLRVTDPQASRYFMSISEAVCLILSAARIGRGGETFIFDMGDPINIYELACTLSLYSGLAPEEELPIQFTGLRTGEKVNEELWESWECPQPTEHPRIFGLAGVDPLPIDILSVVERLEQLVETHDHAGLEEYIAELMPEFAADRAA